MARSGRGLDFKLGAIVVGRVFVVEHYFASTDEHTGNEQPGLHAAVVRRTVRSFTRLVSRRGSSQWRRALLLQFAGKRVKQRL
jgi:hypothetical protein